MLEELIVRGPPFRKGERVAKGKGKRGLWAKPQLQGRRAIRGRKDPSAFSCKPGRPFPLVDNRKRVKENHVNLQKEKKKGKSKGRGIFSVG